MSNSGWSPEGKKTSRISEDDKNKARSVIAGFIWELHDSTATYACKDIQQAIALRDALKRLSIPYDETRDYAFIVLQNDLNQKAKGWDKATALHKIREDNQALNTIWRIDNALEDTVHTACETPQHAVNIKNLLHRADIDYRFHNDNPLSLQIKRVDLEDTIKITPELYIASPDERTAQDWLRALPWRISDIKHNAYVNLNADSVEVARRHLHTLKIQAFIDNKPNKDVYCLSLDTAVLNSHIPGWKTHDARYDLSLLEWESIASGKAQISGKSKKVADTIDAQLRGLGINSFVHTDDDHGWFKENYEVVAPIEDLDKKLPNWRTPKQDYKSTSSKEIFEFPHTSDPKNPDYIIIQCHPFKNPELKKKFGFQALTDAVLDHAKHIKIITIDPTTHTVTVDKTSYNVARTREEYLGR